MRCSRRNFYAQYTLYTAGKCGVSYSPKFGGAVVYKD